MSKTNLSKWAKDNMVILVVVPLIAGIHWGWTKLQNVPYLVEPSEKTKEMPIISAFKVYKDRVFQKIESFSKEDPSDSVEK